MQKAYTEQRGDEGTNGRYKEIGATEDKGTRGIAPRMEGKLRSGGEVEATRWGGCGEGERWEGRRGEGGMHQHWQARQRGHGLIAD